MITGQYEIEEDMRKQRYIADLERQLATAQATIAALQWTPITPDNLPKVGDELARFPGDPSVRLCQVQVWQVGENAGHEQPFSFRWRLSEWTHFRPISPPAQDSATEGERAAGQRAAEGAKQ